ncbi:interleukin-17 receptor B isoform X2 [Onychostoma macrolepis]|uniref:interleukin-17 receptor B isoform X2 n=1 Tax=Onychostoma macrolepis TaxID=369639 RepID=UPI00272C7F43|nr:interleukin-17 receptor B isoform X2 [Onychostoma macrolepis]
MQRKWKSKCGSIRSLTGTWISLYFGMNETHHRCQYQPPFTLEQISLTGQEQLWFSFTVPNIPVCPSASYDVAAYNIPTPSDEATEYIKHVTAAEVQWNADIYSVLHGDKIVVSFNTSLVADRHNIHLRNGTHLLKTVKGRGECKVEKCEVELQYMGPCEDLMIVQIVADFKHCQSRIHGKSQKVVCLNRSSLDIGVGCVLVLLFVLLCCCITYRIFWRARGSRRAGSVRALLVYPAVDGVFQHSVMLLAEHLQSRGGVSVVIDVWERGSLAEQGPLRWLNLQADLAKRVLIVSPPPRSQTDYLTSKLTPGVPDDTVSASASSLFALTLNLVTGAAHDPHGRDKFWVINLDHDEKSVQPELRGCRTFGLPRDLKKLHRQLLSGAVQSRGLHWVWAPAGPNANLAGAGGFTFAGKSEIFAGDPQGTVGFDV